MTPNVAAAVGTAMVKRLFDPAPFGRSQRMRRALAWANTRRAAIAGIVGKLEEEWLELSEKLEAA